MSSKDTFFKVKTGLGVGTDTLYASTASQKVSIGKTEGEYTLDVVGDIRSEANVLVENRIGVGTTAPFTAADVRGVAIVSEKVGIGTTVPQQSFQVNAEEGVPVVITGLGSFGINEINPQQRVQIVGSASTEVVVVTGVGSVGIGTLHPVEDFHLLSRGSNTNIVITKEGNVGVNILTPSYDVDINGDLRVVGFATIFHSYTGIATIGIGSVGIASISTAYVGFATIENSYTGIATIGIGSVGIASISTAYVGFATIDNSYTGIATIGIGSVGIASISTAYVGFATIDNSYTGIATINREFVGISSIEQLFVSGITTTALLDVGVGATLSTFKNLGVTSVTSNEGEFLKNIQPIVGIATTLPTRTLDVAGDLRVRGEVIDSNDNVGFGYSVLGSQALGISGRFIDAANLLLRNKEFIQQEVVGFITSTDGPFGANGPNFDYGLAGLDNGPTKCKRDVGLIIDAIAFDISKGGNSQCVGAGLSYYNGVTLSYLDDTSPPPSGFSAGYVKDATIAGINSIAHLSRYIVNNSIVPISHQSIGSSVSQLIDTEILPDGDSNTNPDGCANVVSAIYSCVGIVTTIIEGGPSFAPNINYPAGKLTWQPPGARIGNEWFVNKLGDDSNGGTGPGDAFLTIKKAAAFAQPGDTIRVYAGLYIEDGPIVFNERVAIVGEDLRRTLVTTRDKTDLFYVKRGCYVAGMSFVGPSNPGKAMVSFPTQGFGYADGTEENWQSPYVQNCTNFVPDSIGMRIDGNRAGGFKSMVLDAYTQYNQNGIGVSITNFGYAQLVSLFTICCDIAVYTDSGGVCDLNNSNSSFGNFGLWSNGATPLQYTGEVVEAPEGDNVSTLTINVGVGASQEFIDAVKLLRANKDYIASEVVGFVTSTSSSEIFPGVFAPFPGIGSTFDYGGSEKGREFCRRDSKIIIEQICSDVLSLGNKNSIDAGLAYRDSSDGSLTYLGETNPPPVGFNTGYVKDAEIAAIQFIAGISTYIVKNEPVPFTFQSGVGTFSQNFISGLTSSPLVEGFISNRTEIITDIIGIGTGAAPEIILPKGQRPYDGQIAIIDTQYYTISRIEVTNPGFGYDPTIPVEVTIDFPPSNADFFIPAEAAIFETNVNEDGTISSIDVLVSGTGYTETPPTVTIAPPAAIGPGIGTTATAVAIMDKLFFNPISATPVSAGGTTTVTFDEFITYSPLVSVGSTVYFFQSSKIIASSITFEYIGTGTTIVNAIPSKGAVPIDENQIVATNGGKVPFTSTDQSGDFRISEGITINQNTGTISGQAFSKSLQAEVTPLIIALQQ
jgi:hypothetical protein